MLVRGLLIDGPHEGFIAEIKATEPVPMYTRFLQIAGKKSYPERRIITVMGCIIRPNIRVTIWSMSKSRPPGKSIL
jgi:hypothetical protein